MQNEIFDLWFLPWGQGHGKKTYPSTLLICIYGLNLNKIGSVISKKIDFRPPSQEQEEAEKQQQLQSYDCSLL